MQALGPQAKSGFDIHLSQSLLLAEQGRTVDAVKLADAVGIETVTARIAALIE